MKWEESELRVVLSRRRSKLNTVQECKVCHAQLDKGTHVTSFSVVDRKSGTLERWYMCEDHEYMLNYNSVEDCEVYLQQYLLDSRFTNEVWFEE